MTNLPQAGVQLVAQDYQPFIAAMQNATAAVDAFNRSVQAGGKAIPSATAPIQQTTQAIQGLSLQGMIGANVVGNVLANGFMRAADATMQFLQQSVGSVIRMQDLTVTLETLSAREFLYAEATDSMSEAMDMGKQNAAGLLEKIKQLSIASPFGYEQIISVFQMNMAFGQSSEMSIELTRAITNLGSVMRGVPGILQRLSYNFSQMAMVGKIMGRDIRDLAMAGLDLNKVLKLQLGKTVKEVNDEMARGEMTFADVSKALVEYTDKYIGPAAKRASRTLGGLASTFGELSFFAGGNLFKNAGNRIADALGQILDKLIAFVDSPAFLAAGAAIDLFVANIVSAVSVLSGGWLKTYEQSQAEFKAAEKAAEAALEGIVDAQVDANGQIISNQQEQTASMVGEWAAQAEAALTWGVEVITQFATGFIEGAANVLVGAMDFVSNMLSYWLAPGSPPRVSPDIDKWGASAINEFLKGFTEADFDLLNAITKPLQDALSLAADMGMIAPDSVNQTLADFTKSIISAASGATDIEKVLSDIRATAGPFANEVADLAEKQFTLAAASKEVEYWTNQVNEAQKRAYGAGKQVSKGIKEYNDLLRAGASKDVLKAKLAEINASRKAQSEAYAEAGAAQEKAQAAAEGIGTIKEQIGLQSQLIAQLSELARLYGTAPAEQRATGRAGAGEAPAPKWEAPDTSNISEAFENARAAIQQKFATIFKPLTDAWQNEMKPTLLKIEMAWDRMTQAISRTWMKYVTPILVSIRNWYKESGIKEFVDKATKKLNELADSEFFGNFVKNLGKVAGAIAVIRGGVALFFGALAAGKFIIALLGTIGATIVAVFTSPIVLIGLAIAAIVGLWTAWQMNLGNIQGKWQEFSTWLSENWRMFWEGLKQKVTEFGEGVKARWNEFTASISEAWTQFSEGLKSKWQEFWDTITDKAKKAVKWLEGKMGLDFEEISKRWGVIWDGIKLIASTVWDAISEKVTTKFTEVKTTIDGKIAEIKTAWDTFWKEAQTKVENVWKALADTVSTKFGEVKTTIETKVGEIKASWDGLWSGLSVGIDGIITNIGTAVSNAYESLKSIGRDIIQGIIDGTLTMAGQMTLALTQLIEDSLRALLSALSINLPGGGPSTQQPPQAEDSFMPSSQAGGMLPDAYSGFNPVSAAGFQMANQFSQSSVRPPSTRFSASRTSASTKPLVQVTFGDVYISDAQEGQMFESRVERAVLKALGAV